MKLWTSNGFEADTKEHDVNSPEDIDEFIRFHLTPMVEVSTFHPFADTHLDGLILAYVHRLTNKTQIMLHIERKDGLPTVEWYEIDKLNLAIESFISQVMIFGFLDKPRDTFGYQCYSCHQDISKGEAEITFTLWEDKVQDILTEEAYGRFSQEVEFVHCSGPDEQFFGREHDYTIVLCAECVVKALVKAAGPIED